MSIFDPVYRPNKGQGFLARKQATDRKRKREELEEDSNDDGGVVDLKSTSATPRQSGSAFNHPVNRTDPYHVAGYSRQDDLPPPPFPHAAVRSREPYLKIEEELAALNPPIRLSTRENAKPTSLQRRHVDNLTTLLHTCILRGDWERASRAWSLLLRTEIYGGSMDLRQQGRWGIGGELLMRRKPASDHGKADSEEAVSSFSDDGFKAAREYYERLILQYPHTSRTQHNVNALAFYPALLNVWIFEVQDRAKRRQKEAEAAPRTFSSVPQRSDDASPDAALRKQELDEALPIAQRMDELLVSPPYDSSATLLQILGMVGLWLADLRGGSGSKEDEDTDHSTDDAEGGRGPGQWEREMAMTFFRRAKGAGAELPANIDVLVRNMYDGT
ncbi:hypothetical protein LTR56_015108 [Elasticomyces elasticus]|nr:hypothetical protein LTR56_015108 [Elasticomyces elasticus]KAK3651951.1 hypothetical protein LTR22_011881 [Elasticomyces elasticus]KAK4919097.1 hypothetical protein LTR49_013268 [Elasticomyces elasticus]KAK5765671.1 hypothetical protein LTS12_004177 [Elasticomyces elasticus]